MKIRLLLIAQSMFRLLASQGDIFFRQQNVSGFNENSMRPLRRHFQIVFQDPFSSLSPRMTVQQIIEEGLKLHFTELDAQQRQQKIVDVLQEVGLEQDVLWRYPHEFSGGQRQRDLSLFYSATCCSALRSITRL